MQKNLNGYERFVRLVLGGILIFSGAILFSHPVAKIATILAGFAAIAEALCARCMLMSWLGVKARSDILSHETRNLIGLLAIQFVIAYEWWSAGWGKVSNPEFVENMTKTLGYFASANPFPWYQEFLRGVVIQNSSIFAYAIEWSQIGMAITLACASWWHMYARSENQKRWSVALMIPGLLGGLLMNANFYFAAGWTSLATHGVNLLMFWAQAILLYVWLSRLLPSTKRS